MITTNEIKLIKIQKCEFLNEFIVFYHVFMLVNNDAVDTSIYIHNFILKRKLSLLIL